MTADREAVPLDATAALQAVWDIGDELDSNHTRYAAALVAERNGLTIRAHNDFSDPPRNRNQEIIAKLEGELDQLRAERIDVEAAVRDLSALIPADRWPLVRLETHRVVSAALASQTREEGTP